MLALTACSGAWVPTANLAAPPLASSAPRLLHIPSSRRRSAAPLLQQGPLEEGFKELLPLTQQEGNVEQELVDRVDAEVFELTGVYLDDLLNPSKVVNYEREVIILNRQVSRTLPLARAD